MTTHLDRITAKDGYLFARLEPAEGIIAPPGLAGSSGDAALEPICKTILAMFDLDPIKDESKLRALVGQNTILAAKTTWGRAVVVIPTGHPQAKSAGRVLRRSLLKKLRGQAPVGDSQPPSAEGPRSPRWPGSLPH